MPLAPSAHEPPVERVVELEAAVRASPARTDVRLDAAFRAVVTVRTRWWRSGLPSGRSAHRAHMFVIAPLAVGPRVFHVPAAPHRPLLAGAAQLLSFPRHHACLDRKLANAVQHLCRSGDTPAGGTTNGKALRRGGGQEVIARQTGMPPRPQKPFVRINICDVPLLFPLLIRN
jgi:hypothetical protein